MLRKRFLAITMLALLFVSVFGVNAYAALPSTSQSVTVTATVAPTISMTVSTGTIAFGSVSPSTPTYSLPSAVTLTVSSNSLYELTAQSTGDFSGAGGNTMTIGHLAVRKNGTIPWFAVSSATPVVIETGLPATASAGTPVDMQLTSDWSVKPDAYTATLNFVATQI